MNKILYLLSEVRDEIDYRIDRVRHPERHFDLMIKQMISEKTGFKASKIKLLNVYKSNMRVNNEFDSFEFVYNNKEYMLNRHNQLFEM